MKWSGHRVAFVKFAALAVIGCAAGAPALLASGGRPVAVSERITGAQAVVVARAHSVAPEWRQNAHGDRLIVSRVLLQVEETLKGTPAATRVLDLEGGTLDGVTLHVSDLPGLAEGERAVFFLNSTSAGEKPHLRGQGILKLDAGDFVRGSSLHVSEIRRLAAEAKREGARQ